MESPHPLFPATASNIGSMRWFLMSAMVFLLAGPGMGQQQDPSLPTAPQPKVQNTPKKAQTPKKDSAAQENRFPQAQSEEAQQQKDQQESGTPPAAPAPAGAQQKPSAAEDNPFPEAQSEKAAQADQQKAAQQNSGEQRDSSSSQVKGLGLPGDAASSAARAPQKLQLDPKLGRRDAQVGHFYLQTGDYKGAYDRFLEATQVDPGNADAVFGLADSARHLNMRDVALRNYQLYLEALPSGRYAKDARKALKEMGAGGD